MRLQQLFLLVALIFFQVETEPVKILRINQQETKACDAFKDIFIQNLIVATDNLKFIMNWEHENILFRIKDEEKSNTRITNCDVFKDYPLQYKTKPKYDLSEGLNSEDKFNSNNKGFDDKSDNLKDFKLIKYLTKRSPEEALAKDSKIENKLLENEENEKRDAQDNSPIMLSEKSLLNYGNTESIEFDNNKNEEDNTVKEKRQAESGGDSLLPIPTGDGETQMFMGTFQAVMRPLKLPGNLGRGDVRCLSNMNPARSECIVTGTLCMVLRVSQVAGVAPLSFRKTRDGVRVRMSPVANCYGQVLSFILWFLSTAVIVIDICYHPEQSFRTRTNSTRIVWVADVGTVGLVVCTAAVTGLQRMRCLTAYLVQLQEIKMKLNFYNEEQSKERARMLLSVSSMVFTTIIVMLDYYIFMHQVINENRKVLVSCCYIFYNISTILLQVVIIMFSQIVTSVLITLQTLNNCLNQVLQEIINDSSESQHGKIKETRIDIYNYSYIANKSINSVIDTMAVYGQPKPSPLLLPTTIRHLAFIYCSICDVIRQVNESHGPVLVALLLSLLLHLVITPYHIITNIFNKSRSDRSSPLLQSSWALLHSCNLLLLVEPCHSTHDEMSITKNLLSQMTRHISVENKPLMAELKMFHRHLSLNKVSYSPMKMFLLDRTLIVTILGSITTYLVVMIQL